MARNPNSVKRATSYAERLRLGIAVIHGEEKYDDEDKEDDGRNSPPLCRVEYKKIEILPGRYDCFLHLCFFYSMVNVKLDYTCILILNFICQFYSCALLHKNSKNWVQRLVK